MFTPDRPKRPLRPFVHGAPLCDDQLPLVSHIGRGPKGDGFLVEMETSDDGLITTLAGSTVSAENGKERVWETPNLNGGRLTYRLDEQPAEGTFTITFRYDRPDADGGEGDSWEWTTPPIPYKRDDPDLPSTGPAYVTFDDLAKMLGFGSGQDLLDLAKKAATGKLGGYDTLKQYIDARADLLAKEIESLRAWISTWDLWDARGHYRMNPTWNDGTMTPGWVLVDSSSSFDSRDDGVRRGRLMPDWRPSGTPDPSVLPYWQATAMRNDAIGLVWISLIIEGFDSQDIPSHTPLLNTAGIWKPKVDVTLPEGMQYVGDLTAGWAEDAWKGIENSGSMDKPMLVLARDGEWIPISPLTGCHGIKAQLTLPTQLGAI